jgi:hypothetical protein
MHAPLCCDSSGTNAGTYSCLDVQLRLMPLLPHVASVGPMCALLCCDRTRVLVRYSCLDLQ